jgi:hypothetical protein
VPTTNWSRSSGAQLAPRIPLEVAPGILDGIQLGGLGREADGVDARRRGQERLGLRGAVARRWGFWGLQPRARRRRLR